MRETFFPQGYPSLVFSLVLVVLLVSTLGIWHPTGMSASGDMRGCPLMAGAATLCAMDALAHLALWQRMFTAVRSGTVLAGLLLAGGALLVAWSRHLFALRPHDLGRTTFRSYEERSLLAAPLDPLKEAFSRGILHPKIYG